jgi:hypothetical protein
MDGQKTCEFLYQAIILSLAVRLDVSARNCLGFQKS